ncbi:MAG: hypothetical protein KDC00_04800 [Flavobacteriales bacterium]|nr:hypothetical protein [Flavobacteriales bacterium]
MASTLLLIMVPLLVPAQGMELPAVNQRVVDFVNSRIGTKVGHGECWDLAAEALNTAGAKWDGAYGFGDVVDWRKQEVLPGDIVQFENVFVEHRSDRMVMREQYGLHTAVVVEVKGQGDYVLAHQNVKPVGKKVGIAPLLMSEVRSGKLRFYRPLDQGWSRSKGE